MHKALKISLIVFGSLLGLLLLLVAIGFGYIYSAKELPVTELDRELIVSPVALEAIDEQYKAQPEFIVLNKTKYIDGEIELKMEYDAPDEGQPYLSVVITKSTKSSDALANYFLSWNTQALAFNANDAKYEFDEDNKIISAGDQSRFAYIKYDDTMVGNLLVVLQDKTVYEFIITGLYIEDKSILETLFTERLKKLDQF